MQDRELIERDIAGYLRRYQNKELLRFVAVGSVDDGKSTLIGRLLHDTNMVYEDQLEAVRRASSLPDDDIDFSLFTDGLLAEREQGITIDVAYRYFSTEGRKFIIADTPGHVQYTRNMVTGASTANVAIILVDARLGVLQQSRRHATIASLLGIPHLLVAVNKMDLVDYSQEVYEAICEDFRTFGAELDFRDLSFIPISALKGANVVSAHQETDWYEGPTVLGYLEQVPINADRNFTSFRLPVQVVLRPNLDYRGFAGQVASGVVRVGDPVIALPSGQRSVVRAIDTFDGELDEAYAPQSVCLRLEDEIDVSRGDVLVHPDDLPHAGRELEAELVWMAERELDVHKSYLIKLGTRQSRVDVASVDYRLDMDTLEHIQTETLALNDIGRVRLTCHRPVCFDAYRENRSTGAFVLVDSLTNNTVAAGMIVAGDRVQGLDETLRELRAVSEDRPRSQVSPRERAERLGQTGRCVVITGALGSGRWALAYALERRLFDLERAATVLDDEAGDASALAVAGRATAKAGLISICVSSLDGRSARQRLIEDLAPQPVLEVFVDTSRALCELRAPEADFSAFEAPTAPDLTVNLADMAIEDAVARLVALVTQEGQG